MSQPETDEDFRDRLYPAVDESDRNGLILAAGDQLDAIGRRYGRFRTGVPLAGLDAATGQNASPPEHSAFGVVPVTIAASPGPDRAVFWQMADLEAFEATDAEDLRTRLQGLIGSWAKSELLRSTPCAQAGRVWDDQVMALEAQLWAECEARNLLRPPADLFQVVSDFRFKAESALKPGEVVYLDTLYPLAFQPPPPTTTIVQSPRQSFDGHPVKAFMVVGRMGLDHTLAYLFLGGNPTLDRVGALVRAQPQHFPGDAVVIDLGESYRSLAAAEERVADMRSHMPRAVSFTVADIDG